MFCAQCKVTWHDGIGCEEFQKLHKDEREKDDIMLMNLAMSKSWKRCPNCRFYVERSAGCLYMKCRLVSYLVISYMSFRKKSAGDTMDPPHRDGSRHGDVGVRILLFL